LVTFDILPFSFLNDCFIKKQRLGEGKEEGWMIKFFHGRKKKNFFKSTCLVNYFFVSLPFSGFKLFYLYFKDNIIKV